jgi:predicted DNA-binding transcriptional regulator YafY
LIKENEDGSIVVHLFVIPNYEMERLLLGFGDCIEILRPENLRNRMKNILQKAISRYETDTTNELKP